MPQIQAAAPSCLGGCPTRTAASSPAILSSTAQLQRTARAGWRPGEEAGLLTHGGALTRGAPRGLGIFCDHNCSRIGFLSRPTDHSGRLRLFGLKVTEDPRAEHRITVGESLGFKCEILPPHDVFLVLSSGAVLLFMSGLVPSSNRLQVHFHAFHMRPGHHGFESVIPEG